jgi:hypothetical protein
MSIKKFRVSGVGIQVSVQYGAVATDNDWRLPIGNCQLAFSQGSNEKSAIGN